MLHIISYKQMNPATNTAPLLQNRIIKTELINWKELKFVQAENFKEWVNDGSQKLIESILKYQFIDPFKVWESDGELYCLDGRHRYLDLKFVSECAGTEVPEMLPATFIECTDIKEAAELVLVYSSHYARITQEGLFDFVQSFDLDIPELKSVISIADFSMDRFEQKYDLFETAEAEEPAVEIDKSDLVVSPGDIFEINGHRIKCGSFRSDEDVADLMRGEKARIVNCDPPYNLPAHFIISSWTSGTVGIWERLQGLCMAARKQSRFAFGTKI